MPRPELDCTIDLSDIGLKRRFIAWIGGLSGLYEIGMKPRRALRSNQQNRFFHGVIVPAVRRYMNEQSAKPISFEAAKHAIKDALLGEDFVIRETGQVLRVVPSTADLTKEQFSEFLERSIVFLAECGVVVEDAPKLATAAKERAA